jgi:hypothetical protein
LPEEQPQAEHADHEEREVGGHIQEVGHAEHRAIVREGVVVRILGDGRQAKVETQHDDPQADEPQNACLKRGRRQAGGWVLRFHCEVLRVDMFSRRVIGRRGPVAR